MKPIIIIKTVAVRIPRPTLFSEIRNPHKLNFYSGLIVNNEPPVLGQVGPHFKKVWIWEEGNATFSTSLLH